MEIRRVEPERITPPTASEHGARVENTRRQRQPDKEKPRERDEEQEGAVPQEDEAAEGKSAVVYQADGHLHEQPPPSGETHTIDYTV